MERNIGFLGPLGTFTEEAARFFFQDKSVAYVPYATIADVLRAVEQGAAAAGVVPSENSIEGAVTQTMDGFIRSNGLALQGELAYPIDQHLFVARDTRKLADVRKVISHPQALAQCQQFVQQHLPHATVETANSTAEAVRLVSSHPDEPWAAIGPQLSGSLYGMHLLETEIQDYDNNFTRFVLVGTLPCPLLDRQAPDLIKTTFWVTLPRDFPGALHQVLSAFAWRKINLTRIESRPTKKRLGSYHFILDAEGDANTPLLRGAFEEITALGCQVRVLGSYPCYQAGK